MHRWLNLFNEAENFANLGQYETAEMKYTQFINHSNEISCETERNRMTDFLTKAYNNRGLTRYKQVKFDDAFDDFTTTITMNNEFYQAYYNRGTIRYRLGDFEKAKTDFERCLGLNPHFEEARNGLKATNKAYIR